MKRLDKFLADSGVSRSEAREMIKQGRVSVAGETVFRPERKVPDDAVVEVDGASVRCDEYIYIMLNKPGGCLSATEDSSQLTVIDLLSAELRRRGLFPVGRLDKDTTGLLLLTDDGDFAHRVISPRRHVAKLYFAQTDGTPTTEDVQRFAKGLTLADGTVCMPARLEVTGEGQCAVTLEEGKYHQVKRMLAACGTPVTALHRASIGALALDPELGPGEYRELLPGEIDLIFGEQA